MNNDLTNKVKQTLKEKVEPQLAEHFGGAEVTEITDDGVVYIKMTGACGQCPSAEEELSGSIKEALISECPEITDVKIFDIQLDTFAKRFEVEFFNNACASSEIFKSSNFNLSI